MSSLVVAGDTSGSVTISAPAVSGSSVLTLPTGTDTLVGLAATQTLTNKTVTAPVLSGTVTGTYTLGGTPTITSPTITGASISTMASSVITAGTAVASTSGTSIDFTSIPSWVKRITVMLNGVSTNSTGTLIVQLGAGSITTSGYLSGAGAGTASSGITTGLLCSRAGVPSASSTYYGSLIISLLGSNSWNSSGNTWDATYAYYCAGGIVLGGTLDRIRLTTVAGTDTFDAGSVNILYE